MRRLCLTILLAALAWGSECRGDYNAALALYKEGKYGEALRQLQPDIQRNPEWDGGHLLAGLCFLRLEDYGTALTALERALALKCEEGVAWLGAAEACYRLGRYDQALRFLDGSEGRLTTEADKTACRRLKGWIHFQAGRFGDARKELEPVARGGQPTAQDLEYLGMSLVKLGRIDEALPYLRTAQETPSSTLAKGFLSMLNEEAAAAALREKRYAEAHEAYAAICRNFPTYGGAHFNLALAEIGLKRWAEAERLMEGLELQFGDSYRYWYYRGHVAERLKKYNDAHRFYRRASEKEQTVEVQEALERVGTRLKR